MNNENNNDMDSTEVEQLLTQFIQRRAAQPQADRGKSVRWPGNSLAEASLVITGTQTVKLSRTMENPYGQNIKSVLRISGCPMDASVQYRLYLTHPMDVRLAQTVLRTARHWGPAKVKVAMTVSLESLVDGSIIDGAPAYAALMDWNTVVRLNFKRYEG